MNLQRWSFFGAFGNGLSVSETTAYFMRHIEFVPASENPGLSRQIIYIVVNLDLLVTFYEIALKK